MIQKSVVKYKNLEGNLQNLITSHVDWALQNLNQISDERLRNCIRKRLEKNGTVRIRRNPTADNDIPKSSDCYTDHTRAGYNKYVRLLGIPSKEIELCIYNLENVEHFNLI